MGFEIGGVKIPTTQKELNKAIGDALKWRAREGCMGRLDFDPPCRFNIDPGRIIAF